MSMATCSVRNGSSSQYVRSHRPLQRAGCPKSTVYSSNVGMYGDICSWHAMPMPCLHACAPHRHRAWRQAQRQQRAPSWHPSQPSGRQQQRRGPARCGQRERMPLSVQNRHHIYYKHYIMCAEPCRHPDMPRHAVHRQQAFHSLYSSSAPQRDDPPPSSQQGQQQRGQQVPSWQMPPSWSRQKWRRHRPWPLQGQQVPPACTSITPNKRVKWTAWAACTRIGSAHVLYEPRETGRSSSP